ncbi:hypothetical protein NYR55_04765 [Sphingomonas sp. BGYR3]|uniref:hypothetical protein n=1 Tax=Sphingomonas sp. BGYR3 TaxID=2975483 RepID=UPI0021A8E91A|nr:hypothetical protein [Sphingomonas sp. BGYR3]MDG5487930.1 hypothetical protein [Sphingomonas sp. BGYR3]
MARGDDILMLSRTIGRGEQGLTYRLDKVNDCPDCGESQWFVGRMTAECACCGAALPLSHSGLRSYMMTGTSNLTGTLAA